ncbi:MAG TPA: hypothetical protein VNJ07_06570 [Chitinophagales bacterium]|nr:hypothetical protein [Chitinophagales bacterium]
MKYLLLLALAAAAFFNACSHSEDKKSGNTAGNNISEPLRELTLERGRLLKKVSTRFDTTQSYSLFIPANYVPGDVNALLFFDPKGDGSIPVMKYQPLAERYGLILAASNDSKNGLKPEQAAAIAKNFINDIIIRFNIRREKIIVSGFSGGARVAVQAAAGEKISGVIGCGAGFPGEPDRKSDFSYVGMVGNEDFNFLEMKRLDKKLEQTGIRHQLIVFDGGHEWLSEGRMEIALLCIEELKDRRKISDSRTISKLLAENSASLLTVNEETEIEKKELFQQSQIAQAFSRQDFTWLEKQVASLASASGEYSREQKLSARRLLNFISLLGFLYSEKALPVDLKAAQRYLGIYGKADYDNPDYHYLMACYYARTGDKKNALNSFERSVGFGFTDFEKAQHDESLQIIRGDSAFMSWIKVNPLVPNP